jgi:hypothetical protein
MCSELLVRRSVGAEVDVAGASKFAAVVRSCGGVSPLSLDLLAAQRAWRLSGRVGLIGKNMPIQVLHPITW